MKPWLTAALAATLTAAAAAQTVAEVDVQVPTAAQLARLCEGCAWVQQVSTEMRPPTVSGLGAVGGAVLGGLLGTKVGRGAGKPADAASGAASAGEAVGEREKGTSANAVWDVLLIDKDGGMRHVLLAADPQLKPGDAVKPQGGTLVRP